MLYISVCFSKSEFEIWCLLKHFLTGVSNWMNFKSAASDWFSRATEERDVASDTHSSILTEVIVMGDKLSFWESQIEKETWHSQEEL